MKKIIKCFKVIFVDSLNFLSSFIVSLCYKNLFILGCLCNHCVLGYVYVLTMCDKVFVTGNGKIIAYASFLLLKVWKMRALTVYVLMLVDLYLSSTPACVCGASPTVPLLVLLSILFLVQYK